MHMVLVVHAEFVPKRYEIGCSKFSASELSIRENSLPVNFTGSSFKINSELSANKVDHFYGS